MHCQSGPAELGCSHDGKCRRLNSATIPQRQATDLVHRARSSPKLAWRPRVDPASRWEGAAHGHHLVHELSGVRRAGRASPHDDCPRRALPEARTWCARPCIRAVMVRVARPLRQVRPRLHQPPKTRISHRPRRLGCLAGSGAVDANNSGREQRDPARGFEPSLGKLGRRWRNTGSADEARRCGTFADFSDGAKAMLTSSAREGRGRSVNCSPAAAHPAPASASDCAPRADCTHLGVPRASDVALYPRRVHALSLAVGVFILLPAVADARCYPRPEPRRTFPVGTSWQCEAIAWANGDTLAVRCRGIAQPLRVRVRGVDAPQRGERRFWEAAEELRRRTQGTELAVLPHHRSGNQVVADVLDGAINLGEAMDWAGWSRPQCARR